MVLLIQLKGQKHSRRTAVVRTFTHERRLLSAQGCWMSTSGSMIEFSSVRASRLNLPRLSLKVFECNFSLPRPFEVF